MSHCCPSNPCPICYPKYADSIPTYEKSPYWFKPYSLSDEDIVKIARKVAELINGNIRSD